ncbi:MAG: T9SS type A sorting domain-containing protein [bacterium]|nr:T9SS type A sorting domain-containing protein [bacterium]
MRPRWTTLFLGMALAGLIASPALAARRTVLLEGFTQWNCGYCAGWNPTERQVVEAMGHDTVVVIKYHGWWPTINNDPFYLWNTSENAARINYYGVAAIGVPYGFLNGRTVVQQSASWLRNTIRTLRAVPAPCSITFDGGVACATSPTAVEFSGTITASDSALSNTQLFVALITNLVSASGGLNGETEFYSVFRDMWPNTNGQTISVGLGQTYNFSGTLNKAANWNATDLSVVVFIQDYTSKWMHQAAIFPVRPMWGMEVTCDDPRQIYMYPTDQADYLILLKNVSCNEDLYTVRLSGHRADGWTRSVESPGIPAHSDSIQVPLAVGGQAWLQVRFNPNGHTGMMVTNVTAVSAGDPAVQEVETFRALANPNVLLVDDDGGADYGNVENFILNALPTAIPSTRSYGVWDVTLDNVPSELLDTPDLVIWFTGANAVGQSVSFLEQAMLAGLLERGGALLLTGQNIPVDLRTSTFLPNYLHSQFQAPYPQAQTVSGVAGDPISDGLDFSIHGGSGADNQTRPSAMNPSDEMATIMWEFAGSQYHAGVRVQGNGYRAVLMGFGMEAIDNEADRDSVLARTVRWLIEGLAAEPRPEVAPRQFSLGAAYPNPFNPVTTIPYALAERSEFSLRIFDVLGREVAVPARGVQDAGEHQAHWNATGLPSGLYFCRLDAAGGTANHATQKLMLLK